MSQSLTSLELRMRLDQLKQELDKHESKPYRNRQQRLRAKRANAMFWKASFEAYLSTRDWA